MLDYTLSRRASGKLLACGLLALALGLTACDSNDDTTDPPDSGEVIRTEAALRSATAIDFEGDVGTADGREPVSGRLSYTISGNTMTLNSIATASGTVLLNGLQGTIGTSEVTFPETDIGEGQYEFGGNAELPGDIQIEDTPNRLYRFALVATQP